MQWQNVRDDFFVAIVWRQVRLTVEATCNNNIICCLFKLMCEVQKMGRKNWWVWKKKPGNLLIYCHFFYFLLLWFGICVLECECVCVCVTFFRRVFIKLGNLRSLVVSLYSYKLIKCILTWLTDTHHTTTPILITFIIVLRVKFIPII